MKGTEKQLKWAEEIRNNAEKALERLAGINADFEKKGIYNAWKTDFMAVSNESINAIQAEIQKAFNDERINAGMIINARNKFTFQGIREQCLEWMRFNGQKKSL